MARRECSSRSTLIRCIDGFRAGRNEAPRSFERQTSTPLRACLSSRRDRACVGQHSVIVAGSAQGFSRFFVRCRDCRCGQLRRYVLQFRMGACHLIQNHDANMASIFAHELCDRRKFEPAGRACGRIIDFQNWWRHGRDHGFIKPSQIDAFQRMLSSTNPEHQQRRRSIMQAETIEAYCHEHACLHARPPLHLGDQRSATVETIPAIRAIQIDRAYSKVADEMRD